MRPLSLLIVRAGWGFSLVAALGGCAGEVSFDSPDSAVRLRAIHRAAAEDDRSAIPKLIEMLESDDSAVRILSIRTLQMMTGQTLGYEPIAPSYERTPAVERWQQWYAGSAGGPDAERKANESPPLPAGSPTSDPGRPENRSTDMTEGSARGPGRDRGSSGVAAGVME